MPEHNQGAEFRVAATALALSLGAKLYELESIFARLGREEIPKGYRPIADQMQRIILEIRSTKS